MKNLMLRSNKMCIHTWGAAVTLVGLSMLSASALAQSSAIPTATVQSSGASASYTLDGIVQAVKQSTVAAQASGRIATLLVKAGDKVRAGQVLATIDDREAQESLTRSKAQVAQAEAELRNAQAQMDRTRELQGMGFVSKAALDTADAQLKSAKAQREQAQAGANLAGISQGFTKVTAPFEGWVLQTFAEAGDLAAPGKPLVTVYAPQPLRAVVQVPASRTQAVRTAKQTEILVQDDGNVSRSIAPVNVSVVPSADPVSQTSEWRYDLPAKDAATLMPGQQIRARFATGQAGTSALLVPQVAVVRRGELTAVYVGSGNTFALRAVRLGSVQGESVEVLSGLKQGDVVALDPVRAANAGAKAK